MAQHTHLAVSNAEGYAAGKALTIDAGKANAEVVGVSNVVGSVAYLHAPLQYNHDSGAELT